MTNMHGSRGSMGFLTDATESPDQGLEWGVQFWSTAKAPLVVRVPQNNPGRKQGSVLKRTQL